MRLTDLVPAPFRRMAIGTIWIVLLACTASGAWQVQEWRYETQLAKQARLHQDDLITISNAAAQQVRTQQDDRFALEQRLSSSEKNHYQELKDAQRNQARLRDGLATAELRLSVLLAATDSTARNGVPATTATGGVVHGSARAELEPAHALRIIGITDDGDTGLIALAACQAYAKEVSTAK